MVEMLEVNAHRLRCTEVDASGSLELTPRPPCVQLVSHSSRGYSEAPDAHAWQFQLRENNISSLWSYINSKQRLIS